jgi:DNA-binding NarL/FixJ family response regulator
MEHDGIHEEVRDRDGDLIEIDIFSADRTEALIEFWQDSGHMAGRAIMILSAEQMDNFIAALQRARAAMSTGGNQ